MSFYLLTARVEIQWHLAAGDPPGTILLVAVLVEEAEDFIENPLSGDPNSCISDISNRPESPGSLM
ncbi:hypothetical protein A4A49_59981 [Nicotiana attenuata]|uniref:Uncharacterized protein n=1 Tax=Nicotiana attenuata TaxID=49451 RepID=A0A1J6I9B6_NICAT|nr:hypothetical protein A4A49_59981 [Nicotiana attenuata]